ncbi:hypothetical protein SMC26_15905 [Actinomadura fulvescens]|uniref:Uncharacterized protein n=1 Tax=Actinomadura fulvescens TaxID=46160 RepID=A0ABN3QWH8_9ACTN
MNLRREPPAALRPLLAGIVGTGLALVGALAAVAVSAAFPCREGGLGCMAEVMLIVLACLTGAAVASWPALWLVGVRPALPAAALGTVASILTGWLATQARPNITTPSLLMLSPFVGFAAAALVCGRGMALPWRIAGVVAIVALLPASRLAAAYQDDRAQGARDDYLGDAGVPLLGPDLPGYVVKDASRSGPTFRYTLLPARLASPSPGTDDYTVATSSISVGVYHLPARFAPPKRCNWDDAYAPDQSCVAAGPDLWRRSDDPRNVVYIARKDHALVTVTQGGDTIDEERLRRVTQTLAPRHPSYFRASG